MVLQAIKYTPSPTPPPSSVPTISPIPPTLSIINQLHLPHQLTYELITSAAEVHNAIFTMAVRGAPAIALVAVLAVSVASHPSAPFPITPYPTAGLEMREAIVGMLREIGTARPTAVNLMDAVRKLEKVVDGAVSKGADAREVRDAYVVAAEKMLADDVSDNQNIGENGAKWLIEYVGRGTENGASSGREMETMAVLTHCNTGSLATAGYGTALGIVRSLYASGALHRAYYTETRPYNQGSRLTGFELLHDGIPATMITDSMAAALFRLKSQSEKIAAVIVGADRVAANGDTANKIGTYGLAVVARQHGVKFLVAAPRTTIDLATRSGDDIVIEERPQQEMLCVKGPAVISYQEGVQDVDTKNVVVVSTAALGTNAWNPSFDVTPAEFIDAIVTEVGVCEKTDGKFDLASLFTPREAVVETRKPPERMPSPTEGP